MQAFRKAAEVGADGIELDVHVTKDGVPIVIHGDHYECFLTEIGGKKFWGPDLTLEEAQKLPVGEGHVLPTLEEVLVFAQEKGLLVNIEIKEKNEAIVPAMAELLRRLGLSHGNWF